MERWIDEYRSRARALSVRASALRKRGEHIGAGDLERDAAAYLRMADQREAVAAGTHYYHPVSGRFLPR